jgi:nitroreductase
MHTRLLLDVAEGCTTKWREFMELLQAIRERHSIRKYEEKPVETAKLQAILSAAAQAPSASGLQPYKIYVLRNPARKQAAALAALGQEFVAHAPVVLVFCADTARAQALGHPREQNYSFQDTIIAMAYAQLAAADQGLASCWVGAFDERQMTRVLALPDMLRPVALMPLGYSAERPAEAPRRPLSELVIEEPACP